MKRGPAPGKRDVRLDVPRFFVELEKAAHELGVYSMNKMASETGVCNQVLYRLKNHGQAPCVDNLLNLCQWAGLDPMKFVREQNT